MAARRKRNPEWGQKLAITKKDRQRWNWERFRAELTQSKQRQEACRFAAAVKRQEARACKESEKAERAHHRALYKAEVRHRGEKERERRKVPRKVRAQESDDEVRSSLPAELLGYWETMKHHYPRTMTPNARREKFERDVGELGRKEWANYLDQEMDAGAALLAEQEAKHYRELEQEAVPF